jgi:hypothetical protein
MILGLLNIQEYDTSNVYLKTAIKFQPPTPTICWVGHKLHLHCIFNYLCNAYHGCPYIYEINLLKKNYTFVS